MTDEEFIEYKNNIQKADIPCRAANCFLPGEFRVSSGKYDNKAVADYIERGMLRGSQIGMKTVVFGSGGARSIPEGVPYGKAFLNLGAFLREAVAPVAEKYKIAVVIEPLRMEECNIINTVKEGAMLSALAQSEYIGVLADVYHMQCGNDSYDNIKDVSGSIYHSHISFPYGDSGGAKRKYPKSADEYDYKAFIDALKAVGCASCSIEAGTDDVKADSLKAIAVLNTLV